MNTKARFTLILTLLLLGVAVLAAVTWAAPGAAPLAGGAPEVVAYQGEVRVTGTPYDGSGYFKFAIVNAAGTTTYWSNDGISTGGDEPTATVPLTVTEGLFGLLLGDTALDGMEEALTADVFSEPDRRLRVWFSDDGSGFDQLTPDTRIAAVPYALQAQEAANADTVGGLHANQLETHYQNVVIVAKSGGDYTSVQAAIDSATSATADSPYLVWVAPGVYVEQVTMKPHVHLQGAGQEATVITSTASSSGDWPPTQATLTLASEASLRDLTLGNSGVGDYNAALLATAGTTRTLVTDVTARALGVGKGNYAIFLAGSGTGVTLQGVTAQAENGSGLNAGLINFSRAATVLHGGNYSARGGTNAWGIFNVLTATLEATDVTALGEIGSNLNTGLYNHNNSTAVLYGGDYTGRGGNQTGGAGASHYSTITAIGVTALAEGGTGDVGNYAMGCYDNSTATLSGGLFIARGGVNNYALSNELTVTMKADNVTALAEDGSGGNYGFWNVNNATAVVHGASFTARGGKYATGVDSRGSGTTLAAVGITALGEDGSIVNSGLHNYLGAAATLSGGSFTGREGINAYGILNEESSAMLEASNITVLGENGSTLSYGMENYNGSVARLHGGAYTGRGGGQASGVQNTLGSTLTAEDITALAENGDSENYGLYNNNTVTTTLRGGTFTGSGGTSAYGISSELTVTLTAENVSALAENGNSYNCGLWNVNNATAVVRGASLTGRGGVDAYGIGNFGDNTTLDAASVTALGEGGSNFNFGLISGNGLPYSNATANVTQSVLDGAINSILVDSGTVTVSNSRLAGNPVSVVSGTLTCVAVSRNTTFNANGCP